MSGDHLTDCLHQFVATYLLKHVASSAIAQGFAHMRHIDRRGQHDDMRIGPTLAHLPGHLEATETGHHDLDNEHIRMQTCDQYGSLRSTVCLSDHVHVPVSLEHGLEALTHEWVTMGEQDGDRHRESFVSAE